MTTTPLAMLAACGGGVGAPPPPPPAIVTQPDAAAIVASSSTATGNVLANDTISNISGSLTVASVAFGQQAGAVGQPLVTSLGTLTLGADGTYSLALSAGAEVRTLTAGETRTLDFSYTAAAGGLTSTASALRITITGVNDAPVGVDDVGSSVTEGNQITTVTGNVLTNDTDPDGRSLSVVAVGGSAANVGQLIAGTYGALRVLANGDYSYQLDNNDPDTIALLDGQTRNEVFTYTVSDGELSSTATLTIAVNGRGAPFGATSGNDYLRGTSADDRIFGLEGDDTIEGGFGADYMDGGAGNDTVTYVFAVWSVQASLSNRFPSVERFDRGGERGGDVFVSIENLIGGPINDTLEGHNGTNRLSGAGGHDELAGMGGADVLDGGEGVDTASYVESDAGVTVDLVAGTGVGGHAQGDVLIDIERLTGSQFDDILRGSDDINVIVGGDGNDILEGRGGNDHLTGGAGADRLDGGAGDDLIDYGLSAGAVELNLVTGAGRFGDAEGDILVNIEQISIRASGGVIIAGPGAHRISASESTVSYALSDAGVTIANASQTAGVGGYAEGDVLSSVRNLVGSNFNDTLSVTGSGSLTGGRGADTLTGGLGDDRFVYDELTSNADRDVITNFQPTRDKLVFAASAYSASSVLSTGAPTTGGPTFIYDGTTGLLSYDADGNGTGAAIEIALLQGAPPIGGNDILIV